MLLDTVMLDMFLLLYPSHETSIENGVELACFSRTLRSRGLVVEVIFDWNGHCFSLSFYLSMSPLIAILKESVRIDGSDFRTVLAMSRG